MKKKIGKNEKKLVAVLEYVLEQHDWCDGDSIGTCVTCKTTEYCHSLGHCRGCKKRKRALELFKRYDKHMAEVLNWDD